MTKVSLPELVNEAIAGKVVSFPTDTVPALAVQPERSKLIFALKQRPQDKPLILMGASAADLWSYVTGTQEELEIWQQVAAKYWPGALTLVLPSSAKVPIEMHPTEPTSIGIRVPNLEIAQIILTQTGPLATTSANISGKPSLETTSAIEEAFPEILALDCTKLNIDAKIGSGLASTVAKWTRKGWEILRQGNIKQI